MSTIYEELLRAAETADFAPRCEGEPKEAYLTRMVKAIATVSEAVWEALSDDAQRWYNAAIKQMSSGLAIAECPGLVDQNGPSGRKDLTHEIRKIVALHPEWGRQLIAEELLRRGWKANDIKVNTISTVRSVTRDIIAMLREKGMLQAPKAQEKAG